MCIAVNFYVKLSGHQEALTGLNRGTPFCTSGTNVLWNKCNWTVSNFGQPGACLIIGNLFSMSRSWMTAGGWNEHWHGMLEVAGADDLLIYGMPLWQNFASGRILGSGRLQPRTKLSGCSTCRILSHLCICNIFVRSHPLCPKWADVPWHTGAKSKSKLHPHTLVIPIIFYHFQQHAVKVPLLKLLRARWSMTLSKGHGFANTWCLNNVTRSRTERAGTIPVRVTRRTWETTTVQFFS